MPDAKPDTQPRRPWGWWLFMAVVVMVGLSVFRLIYPTIRQQRLIKQLKERGYTFLRVGIPGSPWHSWFSARYLPAKWRGRGLDEINVFNPRGHYEAADAVLLNKLVALDHEGFHSPSRSWFEFTLTNATDRDLAQLPERIRFIRLTASGQGITDDGVAELRDSVYLRHLALDSRQIGDRGLSYLSRHTELIRLELAGQHITDAGLVHLKGMTKLQTLRLLGTRVTGAGLVHLTGIPWLHHLDLTNSQINNEGLVQLAKLTHLSQLNLSGTRITDAGLPDWNVFPPNLLHVEINHTAISHKHWSKLWSDHWSGVRRRQISR